MTGYETKTMEQLFRNYADANTLANKSDANRRQALIRGEIRRRVDTAFKLLGCDTDETVMQTYRQFMEY